MSSVYVYIISENIVGISASPQATMNGIEWVERDADDPEILQWMIDHNIRAPYSSSAVEES